MSLGITIIDEAIRLICPIKGISIGDRDDKKTWRIDFDDAATPEQRATALDVLQGFDLDAIEAAEAIKRDQIQELSDQALTDSAFGLIKDASSIQIESFIASTFPTFNAAQQKVFVLLAKAVQLFLRKLEA